MAEDLNWDKKRNQSLNLQEQAGELRKDPNHSVSFLKRLAEQGYAEAQFNLAICYENGDFVEQDASQAVYW